MTLCHTCQRANVSCPVYPIETERCVMYIRRPQRQVVLDTETTGLLPEDGHRIIEIGCVELLDGEPTGTTLQQHLDPERDIDASATDVHGKRREDLIGMPRFADVVDQLLAFIVGAEVIIHNAPFDVGFLDAELARLGPHRGQLEHYCTITCTRELARRKVPGLRPSLDNLCDHYGIDRRHRTTHGALLDAQLLGAVYIAMINTPEPERLEQNEGDTI